jgi:hypothetical protein
MRARWGTVLMAVVLAGLGAYLYFVELPSERARTQTATEARTLLPFAEQDITGLTVHLESGPDVVLARNDDRIWTITAPVTTEADARAVGDLVRTLALGTVTRVVEEQASSLEPYGLAPPAATFTLAAGERRETFALGDIGPLSSTLYVRRGADRKVLLTDLPPKLLLNKTLAGLRKKEVLPIQQDKVDRLRLSNPKTEVLLERLDDKQKRRWQIRFPIDARADQPAVRNLLIKLEDLKALAFADPGPERDRLAATLRAPLIRLTATMGGIDHVLKLYQPAPSSGEAFAVTAPDAPIYTVDPAAIQDFTKDLLALQDKRLLGIETEDLVSLSVKTRDQQYTIKLDVAEWVLADDPSREISRHEAILLLGRVTSFPSELRVVKDAGPLAPYGLSSPSAEFFATTKNGTKARLVLGKRAGGLVYAMGTGLPGIHQGRADLLDQIPTHDALYARPAAPPAAPGR